MDTTKFNISHEELERIGALSGIDVSFTTDNERSEDKTCADDVRQLLEELGKAAFSNDGDVFARFVADNRARIHELALYSNEVAELVVLGYKFGISAGNAGCMNDLGALYYLGDLVEQDYAKAAELYEMAMDHGCYQSIINLATSTSMGELENAILSVRIATMPLPPRWPHPAKLSIRWGICTAAASWASKIYPRRWRSGSAVSSLPTASSS